MPMAIANNARLEAAAETLAEYIGFLHAQICVEEDQPAPDQARIAALEAYRQEVVHERKAFTPPSPTRRCTCMRRRSRRCAPLYYKFILP
jgi:hypothetical protein